MHGDCSDGLGDQGVRGGLAALEISRSSFRRVFFKAQNTITRVANAHSFVLYFVVRTVVRKVHVYGSLPSSSRRGRIAIASRASHRCGARQSTVYFSQLEDDQQSTTVNTALQTNPTSFRKPLHACPC